MAESKTKNDTGIQCKKCGFVARDYLGNHLLEAHQLSAQEYLTQYPDAPTASKRLLERFKKQHGNPRRSAPPDPSSLTIEFARIEFNVNADVPPEACLPMPDHYRVPQTGALAKDIEHAVVALRQGRSLYIWGMPGSGKDALLHAWSYYTRTPTLLRQVTPGSDIESWFFSRAFNEKGTYWEEGEVLVALRDGYLTPTGKRVPYLFVVTDFDRATREQAEHLRLITDSIQGRVNGPMGKIERLFPGTRIAVTANTSGAGDDRGRMISANPIDASILDRFERTFQFPWMDWEDEEIICRNKFPVLAQRSPEVFKKLGRATVALRKAIVDGELYAEFSHRAVCKILGHAQDILDCYSGKKVTPDLLKRASRAWLDSLPDDECREAARKMMDPHFKMLNEGDTSHIGQGALHEAFK